MGTPLGHQEFVKKLFEERFGEEFVTRFVQVDTIDGQIVSWTLHGRLRRRVGNHKSDSLFCCNFSHGCKVEFNATVVHRRCRNSGQVFVGNRRDQNYSG